MVGMFLFMTLELGSLGNRAFSDQFRLVLRHARRVSMFIDYISPRFS